MSSTATGQRKITITDYSFPSLAIEREIIQRAFGEMVSFQCKTEEDVIAVAEDADVLIVQWAPITRAVIQRLLKCKAIVRYGIGIDNIDLEAARDHGITVCNVPNYCIDEVADHTFALALTLIRQIPAIDLAVRENIWKTTPSRPMPASRQMIFATIGYGRIARAVLERARACKFSLATCDPYLPPDTRLAEDVRVLNFEEALKTADILSLHLPLTRDTHHLINADSFRQMKPTSLLLNTARGRLIDTVALADALSGGQIAGAALDVFEQEPLAEDHPLRKCPNIILTSHVAWYSELSVPELQRMAAEEAVRALNGEAQQNRIV